MSLARLIPDARLLLALPPEELAYYVLQAAQQSAQGGGLMTMQALHNEITGVGGRAPAYPGVPYEQILTAVTEAWQWLENQLLLVRAPGVNGNNGFRILGRRAANLRTEEQFKAFRQGMAYPKELLHLDIADRCWIAIMRGDFEEAVFFAFRAVEVAVRTAGNYPDTEVGTELMRKAFHLETGPLTKQSDVRAEREALAHLFAGAIGSYKNPHSHRNVAIREPGEAQEMVMLASHLLRIVDSRKPIQQP